MSTEKFENFAQANLNDYRSAIDAEALWSAIEPAVRKEKRRGFFWFWLLSGLLTSAAAIYFISPSNGSQPMGEGTKIIIPATVEEEHETEKMAVEEVAPEKEEISNVKSLDNSLEKKTKNNAKKRTTINQASKITSTNKSVKSTATKVTTPAATTKIVAAAELPVSTPTPKSIVSLSTNPTIEKEQAELENKKAVIADEEKELEDVQESNKEVVANESTPDKESPSANNEAEEKMIAPEESDPSVLPVEEEKAEEKVDLALEDKSPPAPPRFWRKHSLGFGLRAGIGNSITTLTAADDFGRAIRVLREDSETKLESLDFGLEVLLKSNDNGYYFGTGVDYQRSVRRFNYDEFISEVDSVEGITMIIMNPINNTVDTVYGNVARTTTQSTLKQIYNNIHFINIPLSAGYSLSYDNWSFGVEAGALINIATKHKGQIRDSAETFYDLKNDEKNWFTDNVGVSFKAAIQIGFSPADNFQILAGPNFRSAVKVSQAANPVQQEQSTLGFQVVARYWLDY